MFNKVKIDFQTVLLIFDIIVYLKKVYIILSIIIKCVECTVVEE